MSIERRSQLIALSICWVALDAENRAQGFFSSESHGSDLHIYELSVMQSMQGQGPRLIEAAKEYARTRRLSFIAFTTFTNVPWRAPFYSCIVFKTKATFKRQRSEEAV